MSMLYSGVHDCLTRIVYEEFFVERGGVEGGVEREFGVSSYRIMLYLCQGLSMS